MRRFLPIAFVCALAAAAGGAIRAEVATLRLAGLDPDLATIRSSATAPGPGAAPAFEAVEGALVATRRRTPLRRIELVPGEPVWNLRSGAADAAVLYGEQIERMDRSFWAARRVPGWDRTYLVWVVASGRDLGDPTFRRRLADALTAESVMPVRLFGGGATRPGTLFGTDEAATRGPSSPPRARLRLRYDPDDPWATRIASRLRAVFAAGPLELQPVPEPAEDHDLALVALRRSPDGAVHDLRRALSGEPDAVATLRWEFNAADSLDGDALRALGDRIASRLLQESRAIPLLRVPAWLAHRPSFERFRPAETGDLGLDRVRRRP